MTAPRALVAYETSGKVRRALAARGWRVQSIDILPSADDSPDHIVGDAFEVLDRELAAGDVDLLVAHYPCTYLAGSGLHWNGRTPGRAEKTEAALEDVRRIFALPVPRLVLENPVGCISTRIRKPTQIVQPYQFGDDASKKTCLWMVGVPPLVIDPARRCAGRWEEWPRGSGKYFERWANQTASNQNREPPAADRWAIRSETYVGLAEALADACTASLDLRTLL